jgi:hypothetical protein
MKVLSRGKDLTRKKRGYKFCQNIKELCEKKKKNLFKKEMLTRKK